MTKTKIFPLKTVKEIKVKQRELNPKMTGPNFILSILTLTMNGLNSSIK